MCSPDSVNMHRMPLSAQSLAGFPPADLLCLWPHMLPMASWWALASPSAVLGLPERPRQSSRQWPLGLQGSRTLGAWNAGHFSNQLWVCLGVGDSQLDHGHHHLKLEGIWRLRIQAIVPINLLDEAVTEHRRPSLYKRHTLRTSM